MATSYIATSYIATSYIATSYIATSYIATSYMDAKRQPVGLGLKWVPKRRSREERSQAAQTWIQKRRSLQDKVGLPPSRPRPRLGLDALGAPTFTLKAFCPNPIYSSHGAPTPFADPHLAQG